MNKFGGKLTPGTAHFPLACVRKSFNNSVVEALFHDYGILTQQRKVPFLWRHYFLPMHYVLVLIL